MMGHSQSIPLRTPSDCCLFDCLKHFRNGAFFALPMLQEFERGNERERSPGRDPEFFCRMFGVGFDEAWNPIENNPNCLARQVL
jgi:hypothetical protein